MVLRQNAINSSHDPKNNDGGAFILNAKFQPTRPASLPPPHLEHYHHPLNPCRRQLWRESNSHSPRLLSIGDPGVPRDQAENTWNVGWSWGLRLRFFMFALAFWTVFAFIWEGGKYALIQDEGNKYRGPYDEGVLKGLGLFILEMIHGLYRGAKMVMPSQTYWTAKNKCKWQLDL